MKVIVYPHELSIGGSQINAIDLAADLVELGHEAIVYAQPGPLADYIAKRGLRFVPAQSLQYRPAPTRIVQLARLARREQVDLIHGYEWPPCLDAYFGARLFGRVPVVCTVLSMSVSPLVPPSVPLVMGTRELQAQARTRSTLPVEVLEPPIDTVSDHPGIDGREFRRRHGIEDDEILIVTVSRLSIDLKLDALIRAIDATAELAARHRVRLVAVGSGDAEAQLRTQAEAHNTRLGRPVIVLPGASLDPRDAYAAADVVVGMGSSALRAMAIGRPVVVQGEKGFSLPCTPETLDVFMWQGFYGLGDEAADNGGSSLLVSQLEPLLVNAGERNRLGAFGRATVVDRFSLRGATEKLIGIYERAIAGTPAGRSIMGESLTMTGRAVANEVRLHLPSHKRRAHGARVVRARS